MISNPPPGDASGDDVVVARPLRSVLYMPASNQRAMDKARQLPADAIVFDLEDAVAPGAKDMAREQVVAQVLAGGYGERQLVVRCNGLDTPWGEADLATLAQTAIGVLCLPKIDSAATLAAVRRQLAGLGRSDMTLWAMIETPTGVANAREIAATSGLGALLMGTTDLASELRVAHRADRLGLLYALGECVLAARLAGIPVLDGVYLDLADAAGFEACCEQGRALGFDGKTLIHPGQLAAANRVFGPSPEATDRAQRLLEAWEQAQQRGEGLAVMDGKLIEIMHVAEARRTLASVAYIESLASQDRTDTN